MELPKVTQPSSWVPETGAGRVEGGKVKSRMLDALGPGGEVSGRAGIRR